MPKIQKNTNPISSPNKFTLKGTKAYKNDRTPKVNFKSDFKLFAFATFIICLIYAVCILMKLEKTNKNNEQNLFNSDQTRVKYTNAPNTSNAKRIPKNAINILVKLKKPNKNKEQNRFYSVQSRIKMGTKKPNQTSSHTSDTNKIKTVNQSKVT